MQLLRDELASQHVLTGMFPFNVARTDTRFHQTSAGAPMA